MNQVLDRAQVAHEQVPDYLAAMDVCVAHSQGGIGYMLQQSLANVLAKHGIGARVSSIVTEVEVDPDDPAFHAPTKPVGRFFSEADARRKAASDGLEMSIDDHFYSAVVPASRIVTQSPAAGTIVRTGWQVRRDRVFFRTLCGIRDIAGLRPTGPYPIRDRSNHLIALEPESPFGSGV